MGSGVRNGVRRLGIGRAWFGAGGVALLLVPAAALLPVFDGGGSPNEPYSTFLDPALAGAPVEFLPDTFQNYGETATDQHILVDWDTLTPPPPEPLDCGDLSPIEEFFQNYLPNPHGLWLGSLLVKDDGNGNIVENPLLTQEDLDAALRVPWKIPNSPHEYRVRFVTMPSGAQALIFAPGTGELDDFTLEANSSCASYDQDVLFWLLGTHGEAYSSNAMAWYEIENEDTEELVTGEIGQLVFWHRAGSIPLEAFERGMTVVIPEWSVGKRPILWSMIQLVELARYLNGTDLINEFTTGPDGATSIRHRAFVAGGSYGGSVALFTSTFMPWLFRGGIGVSINPDFRQVFGWQEGYTFQRGLFNGNFDAGEFTLLRDPYMLMVVNELERGFGGPAGAGLVGVPVDMAGLSLYAEDLPMITPNIVSRLEVPFLSVIGDEDFGHYTFFSTALGTLNPLVDELRVPLMAHTDEGSLFAWNQSVNVLDKLMGSAEIAGCDSAPPSPLQIDWAVLTPPGEPARSEQFYDELLEPNRSPAIDTASGLKIDRLTTPEWLALEEWEGLGTGDSLLLHDVDQDGLPEVYASTARGDVVALQWTRNQSEQIDGVVELWRLQVADQLGGAELLLIDATTILAAHPDGSLAQIDLDASDATSSDLTTLLGVQDLGRGLHDFREISSGQYSVVNDLGEVVEFTGSPTNGYSVATRNYVEGGISFFEPLGGTDAVYGSAQGFLKRFDFANPGHPTDPIDVGAYQHGYTAKLVPIPGGGPFGSTHLGLVMATGGQWKLALFDSALDEVGSVLECSGTPPRDFQVLGVDGNTVELLTSWSILPAAAGDERPGLVAIYAGGRRKTFFEADAVPTGPKPDSTIRDDLLDLLGDLKDDNEPSDEEDDNFAGPSTGNLDGNGVGAVGAGDNGGSLGAGCNFALIEQRSVAVDARVASFRPLPSGIALTGVDDKRAAEFAVAWVATLHSGEIVLIGDPKTEPIPFQIVGESHGSALGLDDVDTDTAILIGTQGVAFEIDVDTGAVVLEHENSTGKELGNEILRGRRAHLGGVWFSGCAFGMYDGGDTALAPFAPGTALLAYPAAEVNLADRTQDWAGVKVVALSAANCSWAYADPTPLFRSDLLFAPSATSPPTPLTGQDVGNSARWGDLDGDGDADLAVGTHAGIVYWFENTGALGFSASPTPTGASRDLGSRIIGLELGDVDGDGVPEILAGTEADASSSAPEQLSETASLHVLDPQQGQIATVGELALDFGVYGLHYLTEPFLADVDLVVVGTAGGRFHLVEVDRTGGAFLLTDRYESTFYAPLLGAFNAIRSFPNASGGIRLLFGSTGGLFAFDLSSTVVPTD